MGQAGGIRLVCLDLGGVLLRVCGGWEEACRAAGVVVAEGAVERFARVVKQEIIRVESGRGDDEGFDRAVGREVGITPEQVGAVARAFIREVYPGARELVRDLARTPGVRSACLSNTNPRHWGLMTDPASPLYLGLEQLTWRFVSFEIGEMKPGRGIFDYVSRATGIGPGEILFFDDGAANVEGARAAGWNAEIIRGDTGDSPGQVRGWLERYGIRVG